MATATLEPEKKPEKKPEKPTVENWYSPAQVMRITSFGRTFIYGEMEAGRLRSVKARGGRRIPESALAEWQASFDGAGEVDR